MKWPPLEGMDEMKNRSLYLQRTQKLKTKRIKTNMQYEVRDCTYINDEQCKYLMQLQNWMSIAQSANHRCAPDHPSKWDEMEIRCNQIFEPTGSMKILKKITCPPVPRCRPMGSMSNDIRWFVCSVDLYNLHEIDDKLKIKRETHA